MRGTFSGLPRLAPAAVILGLALGACTGARPFDYTATDEIPPGPGLFSDKDGAFKIFRYGGPADGSGPEEDRD